MRSEAEIKHQIEAFKFLIATKRAEDPSHPLLVVYQKQIRILEWVLDG